MRPFLCMQLCAGVPQLYISDIDPWCLYSGFYPILIYHTCLVHSWFKSSNLIGTHEVLDFL